MLHTERPSHIMDGVVRGVPKATKNPIVDGIVTGVPRVAKPPIATPTEQAPGPCATQMPKNSFGSGVFQEGANVPKGHYASREHHGAAGPKHGTKKGEVRKTARRAYE